MERLTWVECPRDALQGWHRLVSTEDKVRYLNELARVGFDILDAGSFVSPKAVPQMADTADVLSRVDWPSQKPEVLVIVGNEKGWKQALAHGAVDTVGYPYSLSEAFQQRNTQRSRKQALEDLERLVSAAKEVGKKSVVYFSMAFGNPYGEALDDPRVEEALEHMVRIQPDVISISDTIGSGTPELIAHRAAQALKYFTTDRLGMHLHVREDQAFSHLEAAWNAGIRRFDTALRGIGGCPFAQNHLVGNMPSEKLLTFANRVDADYYVSPMRLESVYNESIKVFY